MRILLTGSSGWLGRHLSPMLARAGHAVIGIDVAPAPQTTIVASVADKGAVERAFKGHGIEAVIHAGGLHKPDIVRFPAQAFVDVNVTGTLNLLETAAKAGHDRFVFTSTTSLMISQAIRDERAPEAVFLDETSGPLEPRNIYGATKLAAEHVCRAFFAERALNCVVLRTGRFFPEDDDTLKGLSGENLKANEFLNRRLTVEDAARAHLAALDKAPALGFGTYVLSALTPFSRADAALLKEDAPAVIARYYPQAEELYRRRGWTLPKSISRVYDASKAARDLGFACATDFAAILAALAQEAPLPFAHDPGFVSPVLGALP